jgi:glycosyltransferase involved in cell wall biosynthesis
MNVTMYVMNDVRHDSRVRREATTLAAAGHRLTIVGSSGASTAAGSIEEDAIGEVRVLRVSERGQVPAPIVWADRPWTLRRRATGTVLSGVRDFPAAAPRAAATALAAVASLPWVALRGAWLGLRRAIGRPATQRPGWLTYLATWLGPRRRWAHRAAAVAPVADVHHAHDLEALPAAIAAARRDGGRVVYDSHEIFTGWGPLLAQPRWLRSWFARWERRQVRDVVAMVTVNDEIAAVLDGSLRPPRIVVVHNCPPRWTPPPSDPGLLRSAAGVPAEAPLVLSHGNLQANRGLEQTAEAMTRPLLAAAHLVFLGYGRRVVDPLLADPRLAGRVHVLDPVPPDELLPWVAGADVDVMAIPAVDENSRFSSPNKLFESLAAGVPVVTSDLPVRRRIVLENPDGPLGAACDPDDPDSIAAAIGSVVLAPAAERAALRERCLRAAHERWNWETEGAKLVDLYGDLAATARSAPARARGAGAAGVAAR